LLLCAVALAAYANSFGLGLATDAQVIVTGDTRIRAATSENLNLILTRDYWWPAPTDVLYRPVTLLSYLFNYAVLGNGENPFGYHALNFLLHAVSVLLVYALSRRLFGQNLPAWFAAALWAVHPIGTESVANVSGRADLLAAAGALGGLVLYLAARDWSGARALAAAGAVFALTVLGAFAKENAAVLPGLMLLWDSLDLSGLRRAWKHRLPFYLATAAALMLLFWARQQIFAARPWPLQPYLDNPLILADFWTARFTAIKVIAQQLWLMLCPLRLAYDRSYRQIAMSGPGDLGAWAALAAVTAIVALALVCYRRDRAVYFGVGFLAIAMLPTCNLIVPIGSIFAERFLYLPSVGFAIALVALVWRLGPGTARIVLAIVLLLFAGRSFARNFAWQDNLTLASADVNTSPGSFRTHDLLGRALFIHDARANLDRAITEGEAASRIVRDLPPQYVPVDTLRHLGLYYANQAEQAGGASSPTGRDWYRKALEILLRAREAERAGVALFEREQAAHAKPPGPRIGMARLYLDLANVYAKLGEHAPAIDALRYGRGETPASPDWYLPLSREYFAVGDAGRAAATLLETASIGGLKPETAYGLREAFARIPGGECAVKQQGQGLAVDLACPAVRQQNCVALEDLAQAYDDARQPDQARAMREQARTFGCGGR
jgi:hypothetical protein